MQALIIRDVRLNGPKPAGKEVLEVDANTPLNWPISWVLERSARYGGDVCVKIMAHGAEENGQWGIGVFFCREKLYLNTVDQFRPWRGKVKQIDLLVCGAAHIIHGKEGGIGDGNLLCMRLAQVTQAYVRASTATQLYVFTRPIDFGPWEGLVLTYGPSGAVVKTENSPRE